jgi:conjugative relaxase-like TrwC/TraI family protein
VRSRIQAPIGGAGKASHRRVMTMGKPLKMGGNGWKYLTDSVAPAVGEIPQGPDSARYYAAPGTPPGRFLGRALPALGGQPGAVRAGDEVTAGMLHNMLARLADPITGTVLGRQPALGKRAPVAGFDMTFSPPKSVSVMWAMADRDSKALIETVCDQALAEVMSWAEDHVFRTRTGTQGVRHEEVRGVVASSWMHYESRDGDPQLHHHVIVLNRAVTASDGRWRTLDSRGLHTWVVALSERHVGLVEDLMTERFGVAWDEMRSVRGGDLKREIDGVAADLVAEFSRRTAAIESAKKRALANFRAEHGRAPNPSERRRIDRAAWRQTRSAKEHRSLSEMTTEWTERARPWVGDEPVSWVSTLAGRSDLPALRSDDLTDEMVADVAKAALWTRAEARSVFTEANLYADVERQLHGVLFVRGQRARVAERAVKQALALAVKITPPELLHVPSRFRSPDGTSHFSPRSTWQYTTQDLLDAEERLLAAGTDTTVPLLTVATPVSFPEQPLSGRNHALGLDQAVAVEQVTTSGRVLDVLVGPAGTGKTTTLGGVRAVWEAEHGVGSVVGLAPSASAAMNLAAELGIECENTAKWLTELDRQPPRMALVERLRRRLAQPLNDHARTTLSRQAAALEEDLNRWTLQKGQLLIVDEAGMAGTFALDRLVTEAGRAGAKILLVGDWAQLSAIDAGGAFGMLVNDRAAAPELTEVHRFREPWERSASVDLRVGSAAGVDAYLAHDRVSNGDRTEMLDAIYRAWKADTETGQVSLMIAQDGATVAELNLRARRDRQTAGHVGCVGVALADGLEAAVGDVVVTRCNDRSLRLVDGDWVRNRDRWSVTAVGKDGSMTVRQASGAGKVVLPAGYVAEHVELAYASTTYSAQGMTADTAHALVTPAMTGEVLYVVATRGRDSNRLYVDVYPLPAQPEMSHGATEALDVRDVLLAVATRRGAELSAHETMRSERVKASSFERLAREHRTLVAAAIAARWEPVMNHCGLDPDVLSKARGSAEWLGLLSELNDAHNRGLKPEEVIAILASSRPINTEQDHAAVLRARLHRWELSTTNGGFPSPRRMVAGMVPRAEGITDPDVAKAILDRESAIAARARLLAEDALDRGYAWTRPLGTPPQDPRRKALFIERVGVVVAYRERWHVESESPLGDQADLGTPERIAHHNRARRACTEATGLAHRAPDSAAEASAADARTAGLCTSSHNPGAVPESTTLQL